jgi:hypothetical protein
MENVVHSSLLLLVLLSSFPPQRRYTFTRVHDLFARQWSSWCSCCCLFCLYTTMFAGITVRGPYSRSSFKPNLNKVNHMVYSLFPPPSSDHSLPQTWTLWFTLYITPVMIIAVPTSISELKENMHKSLMLARMSWFCPQHCRSHCC